ncbi:T9SS type A sorting domain-containing protein [candidate division WOR-3 bacterium]|uniref:T9SS type A sorting domain-containing protein n=1 Tax=candidate division WOR-3 bacterium TaxID=2052148 RepID=A0A938BSZ8_UNCW3|nr:T9SS type A sorting domain-containing protein [candidate division WOR-3 bacterium]
MNRLVAVLLGAAVATAAFGREPRLEEHLAVRESLSRVHPRMRARWLKERGVEDPYYTSVRMPATESSGLELIGRWSYGPSYDVDGRTTPSETLVALARGSGVSLLRFSRRDSLSIELLSDINAEGLMCRVKVAGTLLYVGSRKGLEIYNIADEQNPMRLSWTPLPLNDFALQDSLVYTISGYYSDGGDDDSFRIYNVSNPANPVFRGACRDSGYLVSVAGNTAFIGDRWGLYVIDVTNPASPHRIGSWGSAIEQVEVRGHLCYVTTFNPNVPGDITFHVLDVAVPSLPYQIGSLDSAGGNDVFLVDTLAFGAGESDFNRMTIVSIADSTRPRLLGSAGRPGWGYGVWTNGLAQTAFVGSHWTGLQIYDIGNTSLPVRDTFLLDADQALDVYIDNDRAYVANQMSGLKILDVTDPARPTTAGSYDTAGQRPFMSSVVARDSLAFVDWYAVPVFRVMEVSDPSRPLMLGGVDVFNPPEDMVLRDSFVYCAEMNRFQIVNVARPREPVLVGSCNTQEQAYGLCVADSLAYVANYPFAIINVKQPSNPSVVGTISRGAWNGTVRDTFLFLSSGSILVYSVADPSQPRLLDSLSVGAITFWVEAVGSLLYTNNTDGVRVVDASDVHNMRVRGYATLPYSVGRLSYASPHLYVACGEAGVCIFESTQVAVSEERHAVPRGGGLFVKPNPARGVALLLGAQGLSYPVVVRDVAGRVVPRAVASHETNGGLTLDLTGVPPGVYFVEVKTREEAARVKFVRQ